MSNVTSIKGTIPKDRKIQEMATGEVGYTVPWAYQDGNLNEDFTIGTKGGTATLRVECVVPGRYSIHFEKHEKPKPRSMARRRSGIRRLLRL